MAKLQVHNLSISLGGPRRGPEQSLDQPLGAGAEKLPQVGAFATRHFRRCLEGGEGLDDR